MLRTRGDYEEKPKVVKENGVEHLKVIREEKNLSQKKTFAIEHQRLQLNPSKNKDFMSYSFKH